jgi:hypothetical protein
MLCVATIILVLKSFGVQLLFLIFPPSRTRLIMNRKAKMQMDEMLLSALPPPPLNTHLTSQTHRTLPYGKSFKPTIPYESDGARVGQ